MTRTRPVSLIVLAVIGAAATWLLEVALAAGGRAVVIPPFTLAAALVLIGVIIIVMALPVRRVSRRMPNARIDPFYATRVVMLAKASSLTGALLAGGGSGILAYLLSRSITPVAGSVAMTVAAGVAAIVLMVAGLVAEHMCAIPPDDEHPKPGPRGPGAAGIS